MIGSLSLPALGVTLPYEAPVREDETTDRSTMWYASAHTRERELVEVRAHVHTMRKSVYAIVVIVTGEKREPVRIRESGSSWAEVDSRVAAKALALGVVDHLAAITVLGRAA